MKARKASLEKEKAPIQLTKAWDAGERLGVGPDSTCIFFHVPNRADTDEPECKEKKREEARKEAPADKPEYVGGGCVSVRAVRR